MWRFSFDNDFKILKVTMPEGYKHFKWEHPNMDSGICAAHIWRGLIERGVIPRVEIKEEQD